MEHTVEGVNVEQVTDWFRAHVPDCRPPFTFRLIAGGHSNLTFEVTDQAGRSWVLRRPPLGQVLATAHDMEREHRIISALAPTPVPVAPAVGLCTDPAVNDAPFYVMEFVPGLVVRDATVAATMSMDQRRRAGESVVDTLAAIHAVDPAAVGLDQLGRSEGYIERQLKRWYGQWEKSKTRDLAAVDQVHDQLLATVPPQGPATIVHGDYRLDNCMIDPSGQVAAVLDWEICTLGDPLADVGLLLVYWNEPDDPFSALPTGPTAVPGFARRTELLDRYAQASGRDLSAIGFYVAFGYWKLACILEGVYARYAGGSMGHGTDDAVVDLFARQVEMLAQAASDAMDQVA